MTSVFSRIIEGELPGRFVWRDDTCVVFLSINPIKRGHALVVPIAEVDHWLDLDPVVVRHLLDVARVVGEAQMTAFAPARVGLIIAGFEVPHCHVHVIPADAMRDLDFANAAADPDPADLDRAAEALREALRAAGRAEVAGDS